LLLRRLRAKRVEQLLQQPNDRIGAIFDARQAFLDRIRLRAGEQRAPSSTTSIELRARRLDPADLA
jgi:hypothetical protein